MVSGIGQRFIGPLGNFSKRHAFEACQFYGPALRLIQLLDARADQLLCIPSGGLLRANASGVGSVEIIEAPSPEVFLAVQTSMIGILEEPVSHAATGRIELDRIAVDLQKDVLHQILGFAAVA